MSTRFRATIVSNVARGKVDRFRLAVQRYAKVEHLWIAFSHASVVASGSDAPGQVRILIDSIGEDHQGQDASDAAGETVSRALRHIGSVLVFDRAAVSVIETWE